MFTLRIFIVSTNNPVDCLFENIPKQITFNSLYRNKMVLNWRWEANFTIPCGRTKLGSVGICPDDLFRVHGWEIHYHYPITSYAENLSTVHGAHVETRPGFKWQWWRNSPDLRHRFPKFGTPKTEVLSPCTVSLGVSNNSGRCFRDLRRGPCGREFLANWRQEHKRQDLQDPEVQDYRHLHGCKKSCYDTHLYIDNLKCQRTANLKCFHSQSFTHLSRTNGFHFKRAINVHILLGVCVHTFTNKDTSKRGCFCNTTRSMQNLQNLHTCPNP